MPFEVELPESTRGVVGADVFASCTEVDGCSELVEEALVRSSEALVELDGLDVAEVTRLPDSAAVREGEEEDAVETGAC